MPAVGVTGGVACGKTTAASSLAAHLKNAGSTVASYSSDEAVRELLERDETVLAQVRSEFGTAFFDPDGALNKKLLREEIFARPERREVLEQILHPVIREGWFSRSQEFRASGKFYIAEIPLLYETEAEELCDCVIVVAASRRQQLQRLAQRGWTSETSVAVIEVQMSVAEKANRADILIWNDFTSELLQHEVRAAAECLMMRYVT